MTVIRCPPPDGFRGTFQSRDSQNLSWKEAHRYHLPVVSAWLGVSSKRQSSFQKTMLHKTPIRGRRGGCVCGWGPHGSPAYHHPFLPSPTSPGRPRSSPLVARFTAQRGMGNHLGHSSPGRVRTETPSHPRSLWHLVILGRWDWGCTSLLHACLPGDHQGCLGPWGSAGLQWLVCACLGLTQAPDLGRPTADCIPALPPASWVALGKSLYLSMPVSSNETVSSLTPPSRVCGHCMGCVECSAHRAEND